MISREHFLAMKPTALFVNAGRGPCHDEDALIEALQRGEIAGAGLDVFETEPVDTENPLLRMDNVIITPHVASATSRNDAGDTPAAGPGAGRCAAGSLAAKRRQPRRARCIEASPLAAGADDPRPEPLGAPI